MTCLSWPALARYVRGRPTPGAKATSRTQSVCPSSVSSTAHDLLSSLKDQILTRLSQPPVANFFTNVEGPFVCCWPCVVWGVVAGAIRDDGTIAGAQEMLLTPMLCAAKSCASQVLSSAKRRCSVNGQTDEKRRYALLLKVRTEILPSEEAHARIGPSSWGAQAMALTVTRAVRLGNFDLSR